jgi:heme/copper-type cytochrome/quinol oxidase subunit 4
MAPETYYFIFSILAAFAPGVYLINVAYYRVKGKTLVGLKFKPGTADYKLMQKHSSNSGLAILGLITLLGVANLIFDVYWLLHLENQEYARFALIFIPLVVLFITAVVIIKIYKQFGNGKYEKNKSRRGKDNDTWL